MELQSLQLLSNLFCDFINLNSADLSCAVPDHLEYCNSHENWLRYVHTWWSYIIELWSSVFLWSVGGLWAFISYKSRTKCWDALLAAAEHDKKHLMDQFNISTPNDQNEGAYNSAGLKWIFETSFQVLIFTSSLAAGFTTSTNSKAWWMTRPVILLDGRNSWGLPATAVVAINNTRWSRISSFKLQLLQHVVFAHMGIILRSFNYCTTICCWCCWAIATLVSSH